MPKMPVPKILLRCLASREDGPPWLHVLKGTADVAIGPEPDTAWGVHYEADGSVRLRRLNVRKKGAPSWLEGRPATGTVGLSAARGTPWRFHLQADGTHLLECVSEEPGPRWLQADLKSGRARLVERPARPSDADRWAMLDAETAEQYRTWEAEGNYAFLERFGFGKKKAKRPGPKLPSAAVRRRARGNAVAEELVAALLPSFQDGDSGAENSDYDEDDPRRAEWPHNIVSLKTAIHPGGAVHRDGDALRHAPDPAELARCRRLAREAAAQLEGVDCFGGEPCGGWLPFYLTASKGDPVPDAITADLVRAAFHGVLYPDAPIDVTPLEQGGKFGEFLNGVYWEDSDRTKRILDRWAGVVRWFAAQPDLRGGAYVAVGYDTAQEPNMAAVFPRFLLGLTPAGSLAGVCGCIVQA